jgi:hypothetical protein
MRRDYRSASFLMTVEGDVYVEKVFRNVYTSWGSVGWVSYKVSEDVADLETLPAGTKDVNLRINTLSGILALIF